MKPVGLMPVRNEEWCLGLTARAALMWCDLLIVGLHACTDSSVDIMHQISDEHPGRVGFQHFADETWTEMEHRQRLLDRARIHGATHIAIIDADEIMTGNLLLRNGFGQGAYLCRDGVQDGQCLQLPGYNLRHGIAEYHSNGVWGNRWFSTAFKDSPELHWAGDRFHHREPMGRKLTPYRPIKQGDGGTMHLWGADEHRLRAKHALYKLTEALRWPEKTVTELNHMYGLAIRGDRNDAAYGTPDTWAYAPVPESWWAPYRHLMGHLDLKKEPWQAAEVKRLVDLHGRKRFMDLDLFGIV